MSFSHRLLRPIPPFLVVVLCNNTTTKHPVNLVWLHGTTVGLKGLDYHTGRITLSEGSQLLNLIDFLGAEIISL